MKEASPRMKKAIDNMVVNGGNKAKALRDAGYSEAIARNPQKITTGPAWQELVEAYLPDDMILGALAEDIEVKKQNRTAELTLASKLKGRMTEKMDVTTNGESLRQQFTDEEKANLLALL